ncbi:MAG: PH domain-containing protein, partial [Pontixanthobacter sp.]
MAESPMSEAAPVSRVRTSNEAAKRTHPLSPIVAGLSGIQNAVLPAIAIFFSMREEPWAVFAALGVGLLIVVLGAGGAYLSWKRLTYTIGAEDIRVESGIISRAARSIPFERIQDVSLEQSLIPRLFDLSQVKFETGAGGGDDLTLYYLTKEEGERLRNVIKARRAGAAINPEEIADETAEPEERHEVLFAMDTKRLFTFGLFEFSLAVFAVVAGLFQYAETFSSIDFWESSVWSRWAEEGGGFVSGLGVGIQILSALAGLFVFLLIGSITGLVRTFLRDWEFVLERTDKGFRRRRGLLTKTDVVMPVHRVQAVKLHTGFLRKWFGWYGLKFVSLAQDSGSASHDVAPFAQLSEVEPIARQAGFAIQPEVDAEWQRGSRNYRIDSAIIECAIFAGVAIIVAIALTASEVASPAIALLIFALFMLVGIVSAVRQMFLWRFDLNAIDARHF